MPKAPLTFQPMARAVLRHEPPAAEPRLSADERGYDSRWRTARQAWLAKHPLCVMCHAAGRASAATVVDHVVPHRIGDAVRSNDVDRIAVARALFWDSANWQSLCATHHSSAKQAEERAAARNPQEP